VPATRQAVSARPNWARERSWGKALIRDSPFAGSVRLQLHALAYNLANFMRTLALPEEVEHWSLTTLREKLVKVGARIARHGRYVVFQLAEVAVPRALFADILRRIDDLRPSSPPLPA
jgi:Transposase DDE domain group 1